jgi:hypothetical protein
MTDVDGSTFDSRTVTEPTCTSKPDSTHAMTLDSSSSEAQASSPCANDYNVMADTTVAPKIWCTSTLTTAASV